MGLNLTKSSQKNTEYLLTLSSTNSSYRALSTIQGEFYLNTNGKLQVEKKIRIDLIGQLIEHKSFSSCSTKKSSQLNNQQVFFTYSFPLVTSHQNGIARTIQKQQISFPFRIPLGSNLPPSCKFQDFSIIYYLDIYHDERLLPNIRKQIILAPPTPHINIPLPCQITDSNDITMIGSLQKSYYSGQIGSIVPLSISIRNPKQIQIQSITTQLIQIVSLNEIKQENGIFTNTLNEIKKDVEKNQQNITVEINLSANLPPTYIPNVKGRPDNVPFVSITYEIRLTAEINDVIIPHLCLSIPIGMD